VTSAPIVSCPSNTTLVGFTGNSGASSLFNSVSIQCALVTSTGAGTGSVSRTIGVVDTGSFSNNPETAACPTGQAMIGVALRGNCAMDEMTPICSALQCD
jgi:hypothetical protein